VAYVSGLQEKVFFSKKLSQVGFIVFFDFHFLFKFVFFVKVFNFFEKKPDFDAF